MFYMRFLQNVQNGCFTIFVFAAFYMTSLILSASFVDAASAMFLGMAYLSAFAASFTAIVFVPLSLFALIGA